jgi:hypothetical protein
MRPFFRSIYFTSESCSISCISSAAVPISFKPKVSVSTFITPSEINSGGLGPMRISFIPKLNNPRRIATAFCLNQDSTILTGSSLMSHSKASAKTFHDGSLLVMFLQTLYLLQEAIKLG